MVDEAVADTVLGAVFAVAGISAHVLAEDVHVHYAIDPTPCDKARSSAGNDQQSRDHAHQPITS